MTNRPARHFTRGSFSGSSDEPLCADDEPVSGGSSSKVSSSQKMKFPRVKRPAGLFCLLAPYYIKSGLVRSVLYVLKKRENRDGSAAFPPDCIGTPVLSEVFSSGRLLLGALVSLRSVSSGSASGVEMQPTHPVTCGQPHEKL